MKEQDLYRYKATDLAYVIEDGGANSQPAGRQRRNWFLRAVETGELIVRESRMAAGPTAAPTPPSSRG